MIPNGAPVSSTLNTAPLAQRYAMSGGHIRNAVLRAAFLAADTWRHRHAAPRACRAARIRSHGQDRHLLSPALTGRSNRMSEYESTQKPAAQHVDKNHAPSAAPKSSGGAHAAAASAPEPAGKAAPPTAEGNVAQGPKTSKPGSASHAKSAAPASAAAAHPEVTAGSAKIMNPAMLTRQTTWKSSFVAKAK